MYNANPNYEMNFAIPKDVTNTWRLFQRFLNCYLLRIDFAYRSYFDAQFGILSMCMEIYRLLSETQTMLAGYYCCEYTRQSGLHIHFVYLMGNVTRTLYQTSGNRGAFEVITEGEWLFSSVPG